MPKLMLILQIFAVVLYPLASAGGASASLLSELHASVTMPHEHVAVRAAAHDAEDTADGVLQQTLSSGENDMSDCCCAGPLGMCVTLVPEAPRELTVSGDDRVRPRRVPGFAGALLSLLPYPPKSLS